MYRVLTFVCPQIILPSISKMVRMGATTTISLTLLLMTSKSTIVTNTLTNLHLPGTIHHMAITATVATQNQLRLLTNPLMERLTESLNQTGRGQLQKCTERNGLILENIETSHRPWRSRNSHRSVLPNGAAKAVLSVLAHWPYVLKANISGRKGRRLLDIQLRWQLSNFNVIFIISVILALHALLLLFVNKTITTHAYAMLLLWQMHIMYSKVIAMHLHTGRGSCSSAATTLGGNVTSELFFQRARGWMKLIDCIEESLLLNIWIIDFEYEKGNFVMHRKHKEKV